MSDHTRSSTPAGPDYCAECSAEINEWVRWPCPTMGNERRDALADSMCRHSLIIDWYEKADLVLADLEAFDAGVVATGDNHE